MDVKAEIANQAAKAAPQWGVTAYSWFQGWTSAQVLTWVSIGYVVMQGAYLLWKWHREYKAKR